MLAMICIPVTYSRSLTKAKLNSTDLQRAIFYKVEIPWKEHTKKLQNNWYMEYDMSLIFQGFIQFFV